ncbi:MAG TPA: CBS domain-containing protein [Kofleriaceae bacterium]|nr:CBS domain-containing protein [Kofleriaceae bacterium]
MTILQLLTPIARVQWLSVSDTVRDAFDQLETYELTAAPLLDWAGRYVGTVTEADLRRHVAGTTDRAVAFATPLAEIARRAHNPAVTVDRALASIAEQAAAHSFLPVVDATGRLVGIIERGTIAPRRLPSAA